MWLVILYYLFNILYSYLSLSFSNNFVFISLSFVLLRSPRDTFYNLKRLIWFSYNLHSIIITIFRTESVHLLNWKVSQLKCILSWNLKVEIYPEHFISTGKQVFSLRKKVEMNHEDTAQKGHKKCIKKCTKLFYCADIMSVIISFLFHFFGTWLSVEYKDFLMITHIFQILHVLFYFIKKN